MSFHIALIKESNEGNFAIGLTNPDIIGAALNP